VELVQAGRSGLPAFIRVAGVVKTTRTLPASPWLEPRAAGLFLCRLSQNQSLRCRVTPPIAELRQMLLVDDLACTSGVPALDQEREFADHPSRAKPSDIEIIAPWGSLNVRLGGTPPDQTFKMIIDDAITFAAGFPQMDGIQYVDVPPSIVDQT
jgi:hypothetical protein